VSHWKKKTLYVCLIFPAVAISRKSLFLHTFAKPITFNFIVIWKLSFFQWNQFTGSVYWPQQRSYLVGSFLRRLPCTVHCAADRKWFSFLKRKVYGFYGWQFGHIMWTLHLYSHMPIKRNNKFVLFILSSTSITNIGVGANWMD
jgi:hypothetical protein